MSGPSTLATKDFFAYFVAYYPDFPDEDMMNSIAGINHLLDGIRTARKSTSDQSAIHWLGLCESDLLIALKSASLGETKCVEAKVRSARDYFESFAKKRRVTVDFVAGEEGIRATNSNS